MKRLPIVGTYQPKHVSYSALSGYRMCGKKFELERILQVPSRPGLAGIGGNAVHVASEAVDAYILEHGFEGLRDRPTPALDSITKDAEPEPKPIDPKYAGEPDF